MDFEAPLASRFDIANFPRDELRGMLASAQYLNTVDMQYVIDMVAVQGESNTPSDLPKYAEMAPINAVRAGYLQRSGGVLRAGRRFRQLHSILVAPYSHLRERDVGEEIRVDRDRTLGEIYDDDSLLDSHADQVVKAAVTVEDASLAVLFDCVCESPKSHDELVERYDSVYPNSTMDHVTPTVDSMLEKGVIREQDDGKYGLGENGVVTQVLLEEVVRQYVINQ